MSSPADLRDDVARRTLDAGWAVVDQDGTTSFRWYAAGTGGDLELRSVLASAVEEAGVRDRVVAVLGETTGADPAARWRRPSSGAAGSVPATVVLDRHRRGRHHDDADRIHAVVAAGQLTLFIFLTSLTGASYLFTTRQLGVTRRMRAGPVPIPAIVTGEALGRFLVALLQAGIVLLRQHAALRRGLGIAGRGRPAVRRHVAGRNRRRDAAGDTGPQRAAGGRDRHVAESGARRARRVDAAAGVLPRDLRSVAFVTPHAWMNDALWQLLVDGAGLAEVWPSIAVLTTAGAVLLTAASLTLARSLR